MVSKSFCARQNALKNILKAFRHAGPPPPDHQMVLMVIGLQGSNHGPRGGGMRGCARAARANVAVKGGGMVPSKGL